MEILLLKLVVQKISLIKIEKVILKRYNKKAQAFKT